jgi:hypothetical protein
MRIWFCLLLSASFVRASEPWKEKRYTAWTIEEVQRVLTDSPWVKKLQITAFWLQGNRPGRHAILEIIPPTCGGRLDLRAPQTGVVPLYENVVIFQVTWVSRTTSSAYLRLSQLCGWGPGLIVKNRLEREPTEYEIEVISPDMSPFDGVDEATLKENTFLALRETVQRIAPSRVRIITGPGPRTVHMLQFAFPRKTDGGAPLIGSKEKEVEFNCRAGKFAIKTKFQLSKMVTKEGLDL